MAFFKWSVWVVLGIVTVWAFVGWITGLHAGALNVGAAHMTPWVVLAQTVVLLGFLFVSWSKLHLLWLYPVVWVVVSLVVGRVMFRRVD